jgi:hypothetical protein
MTVGLALSHRATAFLRGPNLDLNIRKLIIVHIINNSVRTSQPQMSKSAVKTSKVAAKPEKGKKII